MLEQTSSDGRMGDSEIRRLSRTIEDTLASFKVEAQVVNVNPGPAVTQFEVQPAVGVKVSKITGLEKDLALALAASSIRIEAPIPGKSAVGIEIPNSSISVVGIREVVDSEEFEASKGKLKLPLGKDITGNPVIADMVKMPHLLVAGATGSGKSVAINAFLCGLLLKHTPDELKLILVDPKMVEMIVYNNIPHLLSPVVTELERVVPTLKWATREMERRYKIFARHGVRNLDSYKQLARKRSDLEPMPYILIVIDELADLMMMAPDETETYICRLAQMARATGIHLIIATQRPSVDVITGLIKANFPSRMAFAVTSQVDSRVVLDGPGADMLLGRGDMLYMAADAAKLVRIQGTYVSDREVEKIVDFWRKAQPPEEGKGDSGSGPGPAGKPGGSLGLNGPPFSGALPGPRPADAPRGADGAGPQPPADEQFRPPAEFLSADEQDELLPQAIDLVKQHQRASASLLQRRLRIGYSKAAQLIDLLEQQGLVGPAEGGRSREVLQPGAGAAPPSADEL
jgi:S-DNA-T family DNA segregation ATPase FtsK/SpoIIIE